MSDTTGIEWADATWNPVTGCSKVSQGCKHCYAERDWARLSANPATRYHGRIFTDVQCHTDVLGLPLRWKRPRRIFVNSMSDLFHPDVPDDFLRHVFHTMWNCPQHTFQILTKRADRMLQYLYHKERHSRPYWKNPRSNIWLGVSVENQEAADERIPLLLQTPAAVRWISAEPLLGPISFRWASWVDAETMHRKHGSHSHLDGLHDIDWVVAGGETGAKARPMHPAWVRSLRDQCAVAGVRFLFKQWGEWAPTEPIDDPMAVCLSAGMQRLGKRAAGRLLDGKLHDEYPA